MTTTTDKLAAALRAVVAAADTSTPGGHWEARADAMDAAAETARAALAEYEAGKAAPTEPAATGEHTPEPWRADNSATDGTPVFGDRAGNRFVARVGCAGDSGEANAARIVACVNACAGISTATLEQSTSVTACYPLKTGGYATAESARRSVQVLPGLRVTEV